jgi:hypothetical protein
MTIVPGSQRAAYADAHFRSA